MTKKYRLEHPDALVSTTTAANMGAVVGTLTMQTKQRRPSRGEEAHTNTNACMHNLSPTHRQKPMHGAKYFCRETSDFPLFKGKTPKYSVDMQAALYRLRTGVSVKINENNNENIS